MLQSLEQIDKDVTKAVKAVLKVEKEYSRVKQLEEQLEKARKCEHETYRKANDLVGVTAEKGLDWAVYEIHEALQRGETVDSYLAELLKWNPVSHDDLVKAD